MADYYARMTKEQEERENREARERFAASQRKVSGSMAPIEAECVGSHTDAGVGAAEGIRERIHNRETSRLLRRSATANFL
jgi:hypothetical protein